MPSSRQLTVRVSFGAGIFSAVHWLGSAALPASHNGLKPRCSFQPNPASGGLVHAKPVGVEVGPRGVQHRSARVALALVRETPELFGETAADLGKTCLRRLGPANARIKPDSVRRGADFALVSGDFSRSSKGGIPRAGGRR